MDIDYKSFVYDGTEHRERFEKIVKRFENANKLTRETLPMAYLLALIGHENDLFDFETMGIKPDGIIQPWQTHSTKKATRLAFSMWNGFRATSDEEQYLNNIYNIFGWTGWDRFFIEAMTMRYL
jgi:hypothetical protein